MPQVSVIIPIYGVEKYIERCARSLFSQEIKDIEFIFVNDCTKDSSVEILNKVLKEYPNRIKQVQIINLLKNSGLPIARKTGLNFATGDYIVHCDSDDWVDTNAYQMMLEEAITGNYDIVFCNNYKSDGKRHLPNIHTIKNVTKENVFMKIVQNNLWSAWRIMVKKEVYDNDIIYPTQNNGEDIALVSQLIYYAKSFSYISAPLYYYYFNENSITKAKGEDKILERIKQQCANTMLVDDFLIKRKSKRMYYNEILILKLYCKANYSRYVVDDKSYLIWSNIFPDLEKENLMFNWYIPINLKMNYYSTKLNLYSILKRIQLILKKILRY